MAASAYIVVKMEAGPHITEIATSGDLDMAKDIAARYKEQNDCETAVLMCKNGVVDQVSYTTVVKARAKAKVVEPENPYSY